ncbi:CRISPR-associated helicase Cas3' [Viridibacillus sp. YIM B01967]|uniref:CRISPR-associated helicase Cas3 n=1 Tax=Viridibacillus soli TaxID=2798301 RepID=A0ABS1HAM2_9BACL|nr:CRISPR-associated helicase Cas3' [Viridibacillus soli]MBK3496459.1 CRISPR-associated helicase Cas3' [Viridibacillus soli]
MFVAHIRESDLKEQSVSDHLREVQLISEQIGEKIGIAHITGLAGMLHDMGKFSDAFQTYLREAVANPEQPPKRGSVDHSTAGGKFLMEGYHQRYTLLMECIANAIYSHHGQLKDMVTADGTSPFWERKDYRDDLEYEKVKERFFREMYTATYMDEYIGKAVQEFNLFIQNLGKKYIDISFGKSEIRVTMTLLTKYIFSALLDADRTNTRQFEDNEQVEKPYNVRSLFSDFDKRLEEHLQKFKQQDSQNEIMSLRQRMSDMCEEKALLSTGIYTLSIPTGGGKTLASLRFALKHALAHKKERIIYVVPFTTIIEQNANEVRRILHADDYVLEHHSNVIEQEKNDAESLSYEDYQRNKRLKIAKDNWDAPIIFTTMVQFLDTFYQGKSRNTRRLHNLSNSIVIFDEVQSVPIKCISLFNEALNFLTNVANTTAILCTATQPALEYVQKKIKIQGELIDDLPTITKAFKRTNIVNKLKPDGWQTVEIAEFVKEKLSEVDSVLIILNTKTVVKKLYHELENANVKIVHLSTSMCAAHRKVILEDVRKDLKNGEKIVCVSTQLIEAGVDVSFECVIRSLAGLDSIAQAAGRCNRHGEVASRYVYVINHAEEYLKMLQTIAAGAEKSKYILIDIEKDPLLFEGEILSAAAMSNYFQNFYEEFKSYLNYPTKVGVDIYEMLFGENIDFVEEYGNAPFWMHSSFETAAKYFNVIDSKTHAVLVPYGEGKEMIAEIESSRIIQDLSQFIRKAQQYTVNVFDQDLRTLINNSQLEKVDFGYASIYIAKEGAYDEQYGMNYEGEAKLGMLMI